MFQVSLLLKFVIMFGRLVMEMFVVWYLGEWICMQFYIDGMFSGRWVLLVIRFLLLWLCCGVIVQLFEVVILSMFSVVICCVVFLMFVRLGICLFRCRFLSFFVLLNGRFLLGQVGVSQVSLLLLIFCVSVSEVIFFCRFIVRLKLSRVKISVEFLGFQYFGWQLDWVRFIGSLL